MGSAVISLQHKLADARARLVAAGISPSEASVDVDLYARTILGWDRAMLLADQTRVAPPSLEPTFSDWISRREQREPTAYIVGIREFWGRDFEVTPAVLIPRPETEFVIEAALQILDNHRLPRLADIGTGSGCLAVTLLCELPDCHGVASDVSPEALVVAGRNAERYSVTGRLELAKTSYLDGVAGVFDLVVSNPPYVKEQDKPALSRDVRHEPDLALFGGADGLTHIDGVLDAAVQKLKPGGWCVMEFGYGQEDDVRSLVATRPELRIDHMRHDLQDIPRTAVIQRV
jgi:release factor glutamine methyltransferase